MEAKKVLYISFIDEDGPASSGSQLRPRKMLEAFEKLGCEVRTVKGITNSREKRMKGCAEARHWLEQWRPDLCYIEPPSGPLFFKCDRDLIRKVHSMGIPMGIFYRDIYWDFSGGVSDKPKKEKLYSTLKNKLIAYMQRRDLRIFKKTCNVIYFPSSIMKKYVEDNFSCENGDILPPGCFIPQGYKKNGGEVCRGIYVGAVSQEYGVPMLIESGKMLHADNIEFVLDIVTQKEGWDKYVLESGLDINKEPWLQVHHLSAGPELENLYSCCDFSIIPRKQTEYHNFSFPVKLVEYLSHLLPIVSTDCTETANFIRNNNIGITSGDSTEEFAEALRLIINNAGLRKELSENCLKAREENLWECRAGKVIRDLSET